MCDLSRIEFTLHPPWATHAMGGFSTSDECINHADKKAPGNNYGISWQIKKDKSFVWQWFYPEFEHQKQLTRH